MNPVEMLLKEFNFQKCNGTCFVHGCEKESTHRVIFNEENLRLKTKKELAEVRLCEAHTPLTKNVSKKMNEQMSKNFVVFRFEMKPV